MFAHVLPTIPYYFGLCPVVVFVARAADHGKQEITRRAPPRAKSSSRGGGHAGNTTATTWTLSFCLRTCNVQCALAYEIEELYTTLNAHVCI